MKFVPYIKDWQDRILKLRVSVCGEAVVDFYNLNSSLAAQLTIVSGGIYLSNDCDNMTCKSSELYPSRYYRHF